MPSSVVFNGRRLFRPGVYAQVVDNFGASSFAATGNLAIIGQFPELAQATPITFLSRYAFDKYMLGMSGSGQRIKDCAELGFAPFGAGGAAPSSITFVNAVDSVAASYDNGSLTFKSKLFGLFGNRLSFTLASAAGNKWTLAIAQGGVVKESATVGGTIASIAVATSNAATVDAIAMSSGVLTITLSNASTTTYAAADYASVNEMLDAVAADHSAGGLTFVKAQPDRPFTDIDDASATGLVAAGATFSFTANNKAIADFCNGGNYFTATIDSYAAPTAKASATRLTGGDNGNTTIDDAMLAAALESIAALPINQIAMHALDNDTDQVAAVAAHCAAVGDASGYDRNAWVGFASATVAAGVSTARAINDRNIAMVGQGLRLGGRLLGADSLAVLLAAMQSALPVASSLTKRKIRGDITVVNATAFDPEAYAEDAIIGGLVVITDPAGRGASVERSVTTWTGDDNPIKSELGANNSVNESVRQLRFAVLDKIGSRITQDSLNDLERVVNASLLAQQLDGVIFAFSDVQVNIVGDTAEVSYQLSPTESLNFILITANIAQ